MSHDIRSSGKSASETGLSAGFANGDGLPVILPTAERVECMLAANGLNGDEVLCELPPLMGTASWREIAVNAVMAGCLPEFLPVIGAALIAIAKDDFNLLGVATTTGSATPLVIVNGPIVRKIGMNAGANALGTGNRANATIGRAVHLAVQNIGGAQPGEVDMATLGQPAKYVFCFAENETANPWQPLHVERGFAAEASVVTMIAAAGIVEIVDGDSPSGDELAQMLAQSMLIAGSIGGTRGFLGSGQPLLILPPEHAAVFSAGGYSKSAVKQMIYDRARLPLAQLPVTIRQRLIDHRSAFKASDPNGPVIIAENPDDILIVVAGGVGRKAAYVPTWSGMGRAVSCQIPGYA
jgi:hypothetical protein